jgi:hypothetical protein
MQRTNVVETARDPIGNAEEARKRMAVLMSRSTVSGMQPDEAEALEKASTDAANEIMARVVRRVRDAGRA